MCKLTPSICQTLPTYSTESKVTLHIVYIGGPETKSKVNCVWTIKFALFVVLFIVCLNSLVCIIGFVVLCYGLGSSLYVFGGLIISELCKLMPVLYLVKPGFKEPHTDANINAISIYQDQLYISI